MKLKFNKLQKQLPYFLDTVLEYCHITIFYVYEYQEIPFVI